MISQLLSIVLSSLIIRDGATGIITNDIYNTAVTVLAFFVIEFVILLVNREAWEIIMTYILASFFNIALVAAILHGDIGKIIGGNLNNYSVWVISYNVIGLFALIRVYYNAFFRLTGLPKPRAVEIVYHKLQRLHPGYVFKAPPTKRHRRRSTRY